MSVSDTFSAPAKAWTSLMLRSAGYAAITVAFVWPLAAAAAVLASAISAALGSVAGGMLAERGRLRWYAYLLGGFLLVAAGSVLDWLVVDRGFLMASLGPEAALELGDALLFGLGIAGFSVALSGLSVSRPWVRVVEVALAAIVLAQLVSAHRNGSINRPLELADPLIASGQDPMAVFLILGAVAVGLVVMLLVREASVWRLLLHVGFAVVLMLLVMWLTQEVGMPPPPEGGGAGMGLRGGSGGDDPEEGSPQDGAAGGQRNNDELEFREHDESSMNPAPVAIMLLHDDYSSPSGVYYLRQGAFSRYNGRRLVRVIERGVDDDIATGFPTRRTPVVGAPALNEDRVRLETTVALLAEHSRPFAMESVLELSPARNPSPERFRRVYKVVSAALEADYGDLLGRDVGDPGWTDAERALYLEGPDDERYATLGAEVLGELPPHLAGDRVAEAIMITHWLGQVGRYTTRVGHGDAEDPTAEFLFGDRTGYCVHFAHAATFLMRSQGIPARVATGYAVEEASRNGGSALMITGQASHAWPEVFVVGTGWVPFDVSPQTILDQGGQPPDTDLQRLLGQLLREEDLSIPDEPSTLREALLDARDVGAFLASSAAWLLFTALCLLGLVKLWRGLAPRVHHGDASCRIHYRSALDRLSEVGVVRERGESREAFANRLRSTYPSLGLLTEALEARAYGSRRPRPTDEELTRAGDGLVTERRSHFGWHRRALAVLTPWSWLRSR